MPENAKKSWDEYCERELKAVRPVLSRFGFTLEEEQPHLGGERYLHRPHKLVLLGRRENDQKRVVIKISADPRGMRELEHEQKCYSTVKKIDFAYRKLLLPENILFTKCGKYLVSVSFYTEEKKPYFSHSIKEQFFLALQAIKAQESAHATAYSHTKVIRKVFKTAGAREYLRAFENFKKNILAVDPDNLSLAALFKKAGEFLVQNKITIERYSGFLVHDDFVPHNFRVVGDDVYLLDYSAFRFGNKYESLARFINYLILYNFPLHEAFISYVKDNKNTEEYLSLRLMRVYKLGELVEFYARTLANTDGDLHTLNQKRIELWTRVLDATLDDTMISPETVAEYKNIRDTLRSEEEKRRQRELRQL
jgi:hypothetical protein